MRPNTIKDRVNDRFTPSFIYASAEGTRIIKCNSPGDCCRWRLDGAEPLFSFATAKENANESLPVYWGIWLNIVPQYTRLRAHVVLIDIRRAYSYNYTGQQQNYHLPNIKSRSRNLWTAPHLLDKYDIILVLRNGVFFYAKRSTEQKVYRWV